MDKTWIILLITGILVFIITFFSILKGRKSKTWPSIEATITGAEVEVKHEVDEDGTHTYYYPGVHYT